LCCIHSYAILILFSKYMSPLRHMKFDEFFRKIARTGCLVGLFAFVLMGSSIPQNSLAFTAQSAGSEITIFHAQESEHAAVSYNNSLEDHAHETAHFHPAGKKHLGDACNDHCCGMGCSGLIQAAFLVTAPIPLALQRVALIRESRLEGSGSLRLDRPPRA
jgi:hypothetical protein